MIGRRFWWIFIVMVVVSVGTVVGISKHEEKSENTMPESSQKIEGIVERLSTVKQTVDEIARALGTKITKKGKVTTVRIEKPPFEDAQVSEFDEVIDVEFRLSPGSWRLRDITDNPVSWPLCPVLPDSGDEEVLHDWGWGHVGIRCIAGVKGHGPLEDRAVADVRCQVTPR